VRRPLRYFHWWLALGWLIVIAVIILSLISQSPIDVSIRFGDKVGHVLAYAALMGWFVQLFHSRGLIIAHALLLIGMGIGLEFLQGYTGRHFEYADMAANTTGVLFGLLLLFTPLQTLLLRFEERFISRN
jgi:VanZ family protein